MKIQNLTLRSLSLTNNNSIFALILAFFQFKDLKSMILPLKNKNGDEKRRDSI